MTTNKRLDAIKERLGKATAGDWTQGRTLLTGRTRQWSKKQIEENDRIEKRLIFVGFSSEDEGRGRRLIAEASNHYFHDDAENNADFIAHAKQDIAHLLSLVEKQREALEKIVADKGSYLGTVGDDWVVLAEHQQIAHQALKCDEGGEVEK